MRNKRNNPLKAPNPTLIVINPKVELQKDIFDPLRSLVYLLSQTFPGHLKPIKPRKLLSEPTSLCCTPHPKCLHLLLQNQSIALLSNVLKKRLECPTCRSTLIHAKAVRRSPPMFRTCLFHVLQAIARLFLGNCVRSLDTLLSYFRS